MFTDLLRKANRRYKNVDFLDAEGMAGYGAPDYQQDKERMQKGYGELAEKIQPHLFSEYVRLEGILHGTGNWIRADRKQTAILETEALRVYYQGFPSREDVYDRVMQAAGSKGLAGDAFACKVMMGAAFGRYAKNGMDRETQYRLTELGLSEEEIDFLKGSLYLFPKAHLIMLVRELKTIAWLYQYHPDLFLEWYADKCETSIWNLGPVQ